MLILDQLLETIFNKLIGSLFDLGILHLILLDCLKLYLYINDIRSVLYNDIERTMDSIVLNFN
jgi:hypothetical protein